MAKSNLMSARRSLEGFSMVELMVGLAVGLLATVAVTQIMVYSEGQKRSTTSGADAQVSGALGLYALQRDIQMAGYGFSGTQAAVGCTLSAKYNGAAVAAFPTTLAPVIITQGAAGAPDTVRVLASGWPRTQSRANTYSIPTTVVGAGYDPNDQTPPNGKAFWVPLTSTLGIKQGDLLIGVIDATQPCGVFQATSDATGGSVARADNPQWNSNKQPSIAYANGSYVVNLGQLVDHTYSIGTKSNLQRGTFRTDTLAVDTVDIQQGIVNLKVMYGKDTNADNVVDTYDNVTPTTNAGWLQVRSVRMAIVARSTQYEQSEVTTANPSWDVGTATTVAGTVTCGSSKCLSLKVDGLADWKHYRYKVFDTVIPLRNLLWKS